MVGAEALIVPAVLAQIARLIADNGEDGVKLLCCFQDMLEIMQETLIHLDAQLTPLENNSLGNTSQMVWLSKTRLLLYDIEDILGEYYSSKKQFEESSYVDKCSMRCSRFNPMILKVSTAYKMERMRAKLKVREDLCKQYMINSDSPVNFESKKQKTSSLHDEIIGRDGDLENIMAMLIQDNVQNIPIIPIVGPIGSGKSSLARLIFNHPKIKKKFKRVWVFVPMGSINLETIGKDIVLQTGGSTDGSEEKIKNDVQGIVTKDSCLLVVDNLWGRDEQVNKLKQMLMTDSQTRSKVIVTTHCERVAEKMCTVPPCKLAALSDDHCSTIFSKTAGVENDDPLFMKYAKEIVRRCGGIPLVANFLGSVVNTQWQEHEVWQAAKDKEMWNLKEQFLRNDVNISQVFASFKQIYYYMPHALRLCFVYCSIFPKGSPIDKKKLVQQWIAHQMVDPKDRDRDEEKKLLHAIAESYIKKLEAMSFLQVSNRKMMPEQIQGSLQPAEENRQASTAELTAQHQEITAESSSNREEVIYMHNLAYDLARSVANNDIFVDDECEANTKCHDHRYARLSASNLQPGKCKKLRSLIFNTRILDMVPLSQVISSSRYLRVLDLSGCGVMELPGPIFQLNQLRYLDASKLPITTLSEQMSSFQELKTLDLSETELKELPSLETLTKLNYLNLQGCSQLQDLTPIDKLNELHYLNVSSCTAARAFPASLENLTKLRFLNLSNCFERKELPRKLLESFGKLEYLEDLNLSGLGLLNLPECFGNFYSLQFLNLSFSSKLKLLNESFGNLRSLWFLNLSNCPSLQYLPESFGMLSKLEDLDLSECTRLRELPRSFTYLKRLCNAKLNGCQHCIKVAVELHERTNRQTSQFHQSSEQAVGDKTGGANSSSIAENKNLGKLKAPMISSSPSEADICEEPKYITKVRSICEASSSTIEPSLSHRETIGEAGPAGASFQSGAGDICNFESRQESSISEASSSALFLPNSLPDISTTELLLSNSETTGSDVDAFVGRYYTRHHTRPEPELGVAAPVEQAAPTSPVPV